jgi:glycosyltransferase involved in cell wall biosynthesis
MPKILFLVSTLKQSGTTIQLYYIAKYIKSGKYDLYAITLSPEEECSMLNRFEEVGVKVQSLNLTRVGGFFNGRSKLQHLVDKIDPDVIHTQGIRSDAYSVMLEKKYHVVSSMQNYPFYDYPMLYGSIKGNMMARKQLSIIKKRQNFIACSKSVAENFRTDHDVHLDVIQNGVDTEVFYPLDTAEKLRLREKLNLPADKKLFISVGALIPRKDMDTVIRGFMQSKANDACLLIAGNGADYGELQALVSENDNIFLLGNVGNVPEYMQASDYFISASWAEGLPNTVLEAMACKLPVILSSIRPHREIFETAPGYSYFFNLKDADTLSGKIHSILNDDDDLAEQMLTIVENNFTAKIMSEKYQGLYERLLKLS